MLTHVRTGFSGQRPICGSSRRSSIGGIVTLIRGAVLHGNRSRHHRAPDWAGGVRVYFSLPTGGGGAGRYSLGVAPSSSRTHVMSACVQSRTAWTGHPRVAAISSLLSPETRC